MSMPPQGPGGPNSDPYGAGAPQQGWNPQGANPPQPQGGWDAPAQGGYQPDPYQQQFDSYAQQEQQYGGYQNEPMQPAYDPSLSTATMGTQAMPPTGPVPPAGGNWPQQPKSSNKLPWIVGAAIVVVGAIVAVILLVTGKDDDKSAGGEQTPASQQEGGGSEEGGGADGGAGTGPAEGGDTGGSEGAGSEGTGSEGTGSEGTGSEGTGSEGTGSEGTGSEGTGSEGTGSGETGDSGVFPDDFPVPVSVEISTLSYCDGSECTGLFSADDPVAAYNDWLVVLEDAGYSIDSKDLFGSGSGSIWSITASGPHSVDMGYAGTGFITLT